MYSVTDRQTDTGTDVRTVGRTYDSIIPIADHTARRSAVRSANEPLRTLSISEWRTAGGPLDPTATRLVVAGIVSQSGSQHAWTSDNATLTPCGE